ncbi:hypothetical protein PV328_005628 [Microctonus aethiopoides]|uniref:Uncharacterized protein n=2 Tax=Microctonus aethiopoides TaxID=144406 RepID=A0AA39FME6_9HYME|nr:hypothetical protein PV328_005628 [Microctonus aethiopoides]
MVTPTKLNCLQKIRLKTRDHQFEALDVSTDNSLTKSNWMRKLNIMSPGKLQAPPSSPTHLFSPERFNHQENENNLSDEIKKCTLSPTQRPQSLPSINRSLDVIDLEKVINDFETEYLSPTKQNNQQISNNKFVKKMVAIFEKKTMITSKYSKGMMDDLERRKSSPDIINENSNEYFIPMDDANVIERERNYVESNLVDCSKSIVNYDSNEAFDEGISDESVKSASEIAMSNSIWDLRPPRSNESLKRERAPKIIGAFLKKPIQVENTTIDWLPIPSPKLPSRKKSFSKIFSLLSGKKIWENNVKNSLKNKSRKNSKESQDSGFDEKSVSPTSSTLESTSSSFRHALLHEENNPHDTNERVISISTFQSLDPPGENIQTEEDTFSDNLPIDDKTKIMFEDIPRSEVRLSLGPFYPVQPKLFRKPIDRKNIIKETNEEIHCQYPSNNINEHQNNIPSISQLTKHSYISESEEKYHSPSRLFDEEFNQDELQKSANWIFPSSYDIYDVPRYSSISEPGMINSCDWECHTDNNLYEDIHKLIIPRIKILPRPKSSVYEDAQSLKRRNGGIGSIFGESQADFYASPTANKPKYATIKPRKSRTLQNKEFLSIENFKAIHTFTVPNSHDDCIPSHTDMTHF